MDLNRKFSTNVSMLFLLGLTIIAATIYYVATGAIEKLDNYDGYGDTSIF